MTNQGIRQQNAGKIAGINGPVVDVSFENGLPKIREALYVEVGGQRRVLEAAQHIGNGLVR